MRVRYLVIESDQGLNDNAVNVVFDTRFEKNQSR